MAEEREGSGHALPWVNLAAFAERAVELSLEDRARAKDLRGPVFFDRGLIDAAAALEFATGRPVLQKFAPERFNRRVFMTPPWPEIYVTDADRRHGLEEATGEFERLLAAYSRSEEHTSELHSLIRISLACGCLDKNKARIRRSTDQY